MDMTARERIFNCSALKMMKYLIITDTPTPWREKVYENVFNCFGNEFHVVYCRLKEDRRLWKFPLGKYPKTFLKGASVNGRNGKQRFINFGIIPFLLKHKPEVVVWFSFQPTIILALILCKLIKIKLACLSDTWLERDNDISWIQKFGRKIAYNYFSDAFIGVSKQTLKMYKFYNNNVKNDQLYLSALCADNKYFNQFMERKKIFKKYDLMFSGRIVDLKNPLFFAKVAAKVKERMGHCKVLIIGDGDEKLKYSMVSIFHKYDIDYDFPGYIAHSVLPQYYSMAKILLLPTSGDCWGVVINEAMIAGLPVITTNMTAAAGELVLDGFNGYVLPLDVEQWAEKITNLLRAPEVLKTFSDRAKETVNGFNFENASKGIIDAFDYLFNK